MGRLTCENCARTFRTENGLAWHREHIHGIDSGTPNTPAKVVSFINLKGGVGKSTLALLLGEALAFLEPRDRVLLIDIDLQSNLSYATTSRQRLRELEQSGCTVYHMFASALQGNTWDIRAAINDDCSNIRGNTHLHNLVCTPALGELDEDMVTMLEEGVGLNISFREVLQNTIDRVLDDYDYIFIDCPPSLSALTSNAIVASDYFLVPIIPEELSLQGIELIQTRIGTLKERYSYVKTDFLGSIMNRIDIRRRRDHLRLAEQIVTTDAARFQPFENWLGDWKPLYTITDFSYYRNEGWSSEWPSWERKYGRNILRNNPLDNFGEPHVIWPQGDEKTFSLTDRIRNLTNEFLGRV